MNAKNLTGSAAHDILGGAKFALVLMLSLSLMGLPVKVSASPPATNDWPMFKGNLEHTGVAYPGLCGILTPVASWKFETGLKIYSSPTIADLDGDGSSEVVVTAEDVGVTPMVGKVFVLNSDGSVKWEYELNHWVCSSPTLVDINGDGVLDVIFTTNTNAPGIPAEIYAISGTSSISNIIVLWHSSLGAGGRKEVTAATIPDLDGDGLPEIVVAGGYYDAGKWKGRIFALKGTDGTILWQYDIDKVSNVRPAIADIDGDDSIEIVFGSDEGYIYALNHDGSELWKYNAGAIIYSSPAIADIDVDGVLDVVVGSWDGKVHALSGFNGSPLAGWPFSTGAVVFSSPGIANIDDDGFLEVVVGSFDCNVYALNHGGTLLWSYPTEHFVASSPAIVDVDKDGILDVVIGSNDGYLYAISGDGTLLWRTVINTIPDPQYGWLLFSSPAVADIDSNGVMDVVIGDSNGVLSCISTPKNVALDRGSDGIIDAYCVAIQPAINAASPNDTIIVDDGVYPENLNVDKEDLTIRSQNGAAVTIVQTPDPNDQVFEVTASGVSIVGFTVKNATAGAGIFLSGVKNCLVENNCIDNNGHGIYIVGSISFAVIRFNHITNNAMMVDSGVHIMAGVDSTKIMVNYNNIFGNSPNGQNYGVYNGGIGVLDAKYNWWGDPSGPSGVGPGVGDSIGLNVEYHPWITKPFETVLDEQIGYYGLPVPLKKGWNTLSTPILLEDDSWKNISYYFDYKIAYWFDASIQEWVPVTHDYRLKPLDAVCVYVNSDDNVPLMVSGSLSNPPIKHLKNGWNLIGPTMEFMVESLTMDKIFKSVEYTPSGLIGYTVVVSPPLVSQPPWVYTRGEAEFRPMFWGRGYWIYMENPDTLVGFSTTPLPVLE